MRAKLKANNARLRSQIPNGSDFRVWSPQQVLHWALGLENGRLKKYADALREAVPQLAATGVDLCFVSEAQLESLGVLPFEERALLFEHIQRLIRSTSSFQVNVQ